MARANSHPLLPLCWCMAALFPVTLLVGHVPSYVSYLLIGLLGVAMLAVIIRWAKIETILARRLRGVCERCGYDLRGSPDRCPECGTRRARLLDEPPDVSFISGEHRDADGEKDS